MDEGAENEYGVPSDVEALFRGEIPEGGEEGSSEGGSFDESATQPTEAEAGGESTEGQEAQESQPQSSQQAGEAKTKPEPDERDRELERLKTQLAQMQGYMLNQGKQQESGQQQEQEGQQQEDELPGYDFNIPDGIVQAMQSEDPAQMKQALSAVLKGAGQNIHKTLREEFRQEMREAQKAAVKASVQLQNRNMTEKEQQQQLQQQAQTVYQDYYSNYPDHDDPFLRPIVKEIGRVTAEQMGKSNWDQQLRDTIAKRVEQYRARLASQGKNPGGASQRSQSQGRSQPPHQTSQNARPSGSTQTHTEDSLIAETLMSGFD